MIARAFESVLLYKYIFPIFIGGLENEYSGFVNKSCDIDVLVNSNCNLKLSYLLNCWFVCSETSNDNFSKRSLSNELKIVLYCRLLDFAIQSSQVLGVHASGS